jgi:hypothetical protein
LKKVLSMRIAFVPLALVLAACATPEHHAVADNRQLVAFPDAMRAHTLANMRDHLRTIHEIEAALAAERYTEAAQLAEQRLGMTSLAMHDASHLAAYMPAPMREMGSGMHRAASRFAIAAQDASATHDVRPALAALAEVTRHCVACHAAYRLQ